MKTAYPSKQEYVSACVAAKNATLDASAKDGTYIDDKRGWTISRIAKIASEHYDIVVVRGLDLRDASTYA